MSAVGLGGTGLTAEGEASGELELASVHRRLAYRPARLHQIKFTYTGEGNAFPLPSVVEAAVDMSTDRWEKGRRGGRRVRTSPRSRHRVGLSRSLR